MKKRHAAWHTVLTLLAGGCLLGVGQQQSNPQKPDHEEQRSKGQEVKKPPRKRVVTDLSGFDLLESGKVEKQTTVVGATRGLPRPVALAPRLGKVLGTNPVFEWSCENKAQKFVFILSNDAQEEVFRAEVDGRRYRYPETAPALQAGRTYFWTVERSSAFLGGARSAPVGFLVVSPSQREGIEKALARVGNADPYVTGLGRARVFTDYRLWYDALAAYSDLIGHYPDRAQLYEQRGMIYAQLEVTEQRADRDFERAEQLAPQR